VFGAVMMLTMILMPRGLVPTLAALGPTLAALCPTLATLVRSRKDAGGKP
jgi:hypothetical protein